MESAFPYQHTDSYDRLVQGKGMSLRDWFAGKALQGLLAHSCDQSPNLIHELAETVAARAYEMADAMMEAMKT